MRKQGAVAQSVLDGHHTQKRLTSRSNFGGAVEYEYGYVSPAVDLRCNLIVYNNNPPVHPTQY